MGRELTNPSVRLTAAAQLAAACLFNGENGKNLIAIDVGCDHAKLAIYLVQSGICKRVLASDVNDGPVQKAKANVSRRKMMGKSLSSFIEVVKNDGLCGFDDVPADRIFILGMGGELIADILEKSLFVKNPERKTAFVLQAMTSEYDLRKYLALNGFNIIKEQLVEDKGRIYSLILCVYDGIKRTFSEMSLLLGEYNINCGNEYFPQYLARKIRIQKKLVQQLASAGLDFGTQKELLDNLEALERER